jgi:ABC-type branched-subunit amino acid transport system substrate-binding protein
MRAVFALLLCTACLSAPPDGPEDGIYIGALLPFTGDVAATGTNIERALILVAESVNRAGGVAGRPLYILSRDTHSETRRGMEATHQLIDDQRVIALVGPEDEDLAKRSVSLLNEEHVVEISGGVTSPTFSGIDGDKYWFRTAPSSLVYGRALVERMVADGIKTASILYVGNEFGTGFAPAITYALATNHIVATSLTSFQQGEQSYLQAITTARASAPDAIVLVAYPRAGAAIIQEWAILGGREKWYLAPSLKADVFLDNIPPGVMEGAVGVSPVVAADAATFAAAFQKRWDGDEPLDAAYFYYDAAALVALAVASAAHAHQGLPPRELVRDKLQPVSRLTGDVVAWYELDHGLALLAEGKDVDYRGASGAVDLDEKGDVGEHPVEFWTIKDDRIVVEGGDK